jgi:hypothetical protein
VAVRWRGEPQPSRGSDHYLCLTVRDDRAGYLAHVTLFHDAAVLRGLNLLPGVAAVVTARFSPVEPVWDGGQQGARIVCSGMVSRDHSRGARAFAVFGAGDAAEAFPPATRHCCAAAWVPAPARPLAFRGCAGSESAAALWNEIFGGARMTEARRRSRPDPAPDARASKRARAAGRVSDPHECRGVREPLLAAVTGTAAPSSAAGTADRRGPEAAEAASGGSSASACSCDAAAAIADLRRDVSVLGAAVRDLSRKLQLALPVAAGGAPAAVVADVGNQGLGAATNLAHGPDRCAGPAHGVRSYYACATPPRSGVGAAGAEWPGTRTPDSASVTEVDTPDRCRPGSSARSPGSTRIMRVHGSGRRRPRQRSPAASTAALTARSSARNSWSREDPAAAAACSSPEM